VADWLRPTEPVQYRPYQQWLGEDPSSCDQRKPGYHGQPVAAVAAETSGHARAALAALAPEWEALEPLLDPDEAVRRGSLVVEPKRHRRGDVDRGLAEADVVVEAEYRTQSLLHNALETHGSVCVWEGARLTVYTGTQYVWGVRDDVAEAFGIAPDDVRVVCRYDAETRSATVENVTTDYADLPVEDILISPAFDGVESFGAEIRTNAKVDRVLVRNGRARGVALEDGDEIRAPVVITACHPQITFLRQLDRSELPDEFVADIEHWSSRSGVVKINLALSKAPTLAADPDWSDYSGGFEIAPSIDQLERSFEEARAGKASTRPFSDGVIPTALDPSLAPEGAHVVSLFTQWAPHEWSKEPHRDELETYADRVIQSYDDAAPGFKESVIARQVIGPYDMENEWHLIGGNIFHGELSADQLFHMRPAPGYADYRTPIHGLYQCSSATHAGGGVCGIPAYNCVREIQRDRRRGVLK
jgi:hypothetical protein